VMIPSDDTGRLSVRFVDAHSGRNDLLGRVATLEALAQVVARRLEGERPGSRFPLLQLVGRAAPLTADECDSLVREVARLRHRLAALPVDAAEHGTDAASTPGGAAAGAGEGAIDGGRPPPTFVKARPDASATGTLADAYAGPLFVLEHIARLGAASRRGARFEIGDAASFAAARTPLNPYAARG